jgi:hypothetical protein
LNSLEPAVAAQNGGMDCDNGPGQRAQIRGRWLSPCSPSLNLIAQLCVNLEPNDPFQNRTILSSMLFDSIGEFVEALTKSTA